MGKHLAEIPDSLKDGLVGTAFDMFAKTNYANAHRQITSKNDLDGMDDSIRSELKRMYDESTSTLPEEIRCCLSDKAFDLYASQNWDNVAERLRMNRKRKGFVPLIDVETGTSDASIVQERQGLLKTMDDEKAKQLMEHLKKQRISSISALGPDFAALCSMEPSDTFYAEHYDFRPQPASSSKSVVFN